MGFIGFDLNKMSSKSLFFSPQIRQAWDNRKTMTKNLKEIGISRDPNALLSVPSAKQQRLKTIKLANGFVEEDLIDDTKPMSKVLEQMEHDANEYRESEFR